MPPPLLRAPRRRGYDVTLRYAAADDDETLLLPSAAAPLRVILICHIRALAADTRHILRFMPCRFQRWLPCAADAAMLTLPRLLLVAARCFDIRRVATRRCLDAMRFDTPHALLRHCCRFLRVYRR